MKHQLIKTEDYLLVVSDEEIKEGDVVIENEINQIFNVQDININVGMLRSKVDTYVIDSCKKIIAHLPLNGASYLDGVDVLPEIEDEVEKLANESFPIGTWDSPSVGIGLDMFKAGYNKAKETYKYTEEDLKKAINLAYVSGGGGDTYQDCEAFVVEQLEKELPVAFECDMVDFEVDMGLGEECIEHSQYPKTITNLQGRTEWVGKYEF